MAAPSGALTARFEQVLEDFKKTLSKDDVDDFRFTTLEELKQLICKIQEDQASSRRMKNLSRLSPFLEAMEQYDKVVQVFLNAADLLAFIWGPIKFLLQTASTYSESFNALLEAYQDIGENIPLLVQYEQVFRDRDSMRHVLGLIYSDIMDFHRSAMRYFRGPAWKQMFQAVWKTFRTKFEATLVHLQQHKQLLDRQANLHHFEQYQIDQTRIEANFQQVQDTARTYFDQYRKDRMETDRKLQRMQEDDEKRRRIMVTDWLSGADIDSDQKRGSSVRRDFPQSGLWILQQQRVKSWLDPSYVFSPLLWVNGKPGAGKTVLASLLVEECRRNPAAKTIFFYCRYGDTQRNNIMALLRSILHQLLRANDDLVPYIFEHATKSGKSSLNDPELGKELLDVALASFGVPLYLIIDGLDECPRSEKSPILALVRTVISSVNNRKQGALRCCFFSQEDNDTGELMKQLPALSITSKHNEQDISTYCSSKANELQSNFDLTGDETQSIWRDVSQRAEGMFIFATLVMENLSSQVSRKQLRRELQRMPTDLDQVYERIVYRIFFEAEPAERVAAKRVLSWVLYAIRPLKWNEIQGASSYDPEDHSFDMEEGKLRRGPKKLCGSLVEILEDEEIRLVHLTAKIYLEQEIFQGNDGEVDLLCLCLDYLRLPAFRDGLSKDIVKDFALKGHYSFMYYALASWPIHLQRQSKSKRSPELATFEKLRTSIRLFFAEHPTPQGKPLPKDKATQKDLQQFRNDKYFDQLVQYMMRALSNVYEASSSQGCDLQLASQVSTIRAVIEDVASGSNPLDKARLMEYLGPRLFKCTRVRCKEFHSGFCNKGERDRHLSEHERPYSCSFPGCPSAFVGHSTLQQLKKHERDYHSQNDDLSSFPYQQNPAFINIYKELRGGNDEALSLWLGQFEDRIPLGELFDKGKCRGPLRAALEMENLDALRLVLDRADPSLFLSTKSGAKTSIPTHLAITALKEHNEPAVQEILSRASLRDAEIFKAFKAALSLGLDRSAIKLANQDNCVLSRRGGDTLQAAEYLLKSVVEGRLAVVRFLVQEKGVDPNLSPMNRSSTILGIAEDNNRIEIAQFLTASVKCDIYAAGLYMRTPACLAYRNRNFEFLREVFSSVHLDTAKKEYQFIVISKLFKEAFEGNLEAAKDHMLEYQQAERDPPRDFPPPLMIAIQSGRETIVELMLENHETRLDEKYFFTSVLEIALSQENLDIIRLLFDRGTLSLSTQELGWTTYLIERARDDAIKGGNKTLSNVLVDGATRFGLKLKDVKNI